MQGVGQLTGPVARRRIPQNRVKRFGRGGPRASGQGHGQQQQRRKPQLGPDPEAPSRHRHFVSLCHSSSACCCFLFRISSSFRGQPLPRPPGCRFRLRSPGQKRWSQPSRARERTGTPDPFLPLQGMLGRVVLHRREAPWRSGKLVSENYSTLGATSPGPFAVHSGECGVLCR